MPRPLLPRKTLGGARFPCKQALRDRAPRAWARKLTRRAVRVYLPATSWRFVPACGHVKQAAKRPGTYGTALPAEPRPPDGRGFLLPATRAGRRSMARDTQDGSAWRPATRLVHRGVLRSQFMET